MQTKNKNKTNQTNQEPNQNGGGRTEALLTEVAQGGESRALSLSSGNREHKGH